MGSQIEINDTLKIKTENLPAELTVGSRHEFKIDGKRIYHLDPVRVFLVEEINGKWNYIGHVLIKKLIIDSEKNETGGIYEVSLLYPENYQQYANEFEAPRNKGYIGPGAS